MSKKELLKEVGEDIKALLHRRQCELANDGVNTIGEDIPCDPEEAWKKGFKAGYNDLINDLSNLIDCDWLLERLEEV